jgi:ABC-type dipeptide/oligopeptide/nickel transport system permease component
MWKYVIKRCLWLIFVLFGTAIVIFTIMYFVPGDPTISILGDTSTEIQRLALREKMGFDRPYIVRLGTFLFNLFFRFDFGMSYIYHVPVVRELMSRFPRTMILGWTMIISNAIVGIPLGILAATRQNKWQDYSSMLFAMVGISIPNFWLALMLIILFSLKLGWFPAFGIGGIQYYVLPVVSSSLSGIAINARQMRSSMLDVIRSDFVTTARAKGLSENKVTYRHMLPNALIPIVTIIGTGLGASVAGTVVIEAVFSFPGVGLYLMTGITTRDYPVVQGCVIILAVFAAAIMVLVDLAYAFIDPRINAQYSGQLKKVTK